jgi:hypothetical protein
MKWNWKKHVDPTEKGVDFSFVAGHNIKRSHCGYISTSYPKMYVMEKATAMQILSVLLSLQANATM